MASKTINYELTKPSGTESADIDVINANMDIIDGALNDKADADHTHDEYLPLTGGQMTGGIEATGTLTSYEGIGVMASTTLPWQIMAASTVLDTVGIGFVNTSNNISLLGVKGQEPIFIPDVDAQPMVSEALAFKSDIPDVSGFATKSELEETNDTVSENYTMLYEVYTAMPDKADKNHTHSNYATKTDLVYKQDPIKAGTGITIGTDGVTIGHSNSVDGRSVGSATMMPIITYDDQGHITGATSTPVYPPTSKGSVGQYWRSDGDGTGTWMTPSTTPTSDNDTLISSGGVYNALQKYAKTTDMATTSANGLMSSTDKSKLEGIESGANKTIVDSALSSTSTNPLQNKVVNQAIYNQSVSLGNQISAKQDKLTAGSGITIENNVISATGGGSGGGGGGGFAVYPIDFTLVDGSIEHEGINVDDLAQFSITINDSIIVTVPLTYFERSLAISGVMLSCTNMMNPSENLLCMSIHSLAGVSVHGSIMLMNLDTQAPVPITSFTVDYAHALRFS